MMFNVLSVHWWPHKDVGDDSMICKGWGNGWEAGLLRGLLADVPDYVLVKCRTCSAGALVAS